MPIIKSAKKRVRSAKKASARNTKTRRALKTAVKALHGAIQNGKKSTGTELKKAQSAIDKAAKKNVIHKNKAARKKSQAARAAKLAAGVAVVAGAKKLASKKAAKPAAKKPVAKKAPAKKKPAAKKSVPKKK